MQITREEAINRVDSLDVIDYGYNEGYKCSDVEYLIHEIFDGLEEDSKVDELTYKLYKLVEKEPIEVLGGLEELLKEY